MIVRIWATVKTTEVREYEIELPEEPSPDKVELLAETAFDSGRSYRVVRKAGPYIDQANRYLGA